MALEQVTALRKTLGGLGAIFCVLVFLSIVDSLMIQLLKEHFTIHMLPGEKTKVNGPMPERIKEISELTSVSESESLVVDIERVHTGYWLGGNLWNGQVHAQEEITPGSYKFMVKPHEFEEDEAFPIFTAHIHAGIAQFREQSPSLAYKYLGIKPWWIGFVSLPLAILCFFKVLKLSRIREELLLKQGKAEIVRVKKSGDKREIAFGVGQSNGVDAGSTLTLLNEEGQPMGTFKVAKAWENSGIAIVTESCPVKPGWMVRWEAR